MIRKISILLLFCCLAVCLFGQNGPDKSLITVAESSDTTTVDSLKEPDRSAEDFVFASLCIADPTDQSQDYLGISGHAFLRLQCSYYGLDYCFSYESEKIKGQLFDFLTGNLRMGMFAIPTKVYIQDYQKWQRAVHEYHITMPPAAEQRLWEQMDNHMLNERELQMNLLRFGCTNTLLCNVEQSLSPDTIDYGELPEKYYTQSALDIMTAHYSESYPWTALGTRLFLSKGLSEYTTPKQKIIMPTDLLDVWSRATINGEPLLTYVGDLVEAEPVKPQKPWFTPTVCAIMIFVLLVALVVWLVVRRDRKPSVTEAAKHKHK